MALLRVVLDTNVYISAVLHGREAETVLELASAHRLILLTSPAILSELEEKVRNKLGWTQERAELLLRAIQGITEVIEPQITLKVVTEDDDDNRVLECAVSGSADLIVTFDKDLLRLRSYETTGIIAPRQLQFYGLEKAE
jgi:putative PIN family toxin of toxin-antitoxin system